MAKHIQRSRDLGLNENDRVAGMLGHVRPETKPIINQEVAGAVSPKQVGVDSTPGVISPNSVPAGQQR